MHIKQSLLIAIPALLCGAMLGHLVSPTDGGASTELPSSSSPSAAKRQSSNDDAAIKRLRKRVQELERQLAERNHEPETVATDAETSDDAPRTPEPSVGRNDHRARMEELRKNDPERFTQMTNRFARMRSEHLQRIQSRLDLLASVDTSRMNEHQRQIHLQYQELLAQQTEMRDMMRPGGMDDLTDEQRREAWEQMRKLDDQVNRLARQERNTLLQQEALRLGVKGAAIKETIETIDAIYQATEGNRGRGGPPPHR